MIMNFTEDEQIFMRHIRDLIYQAEKQAKDRFSCFLTEREQELARQVLAAEKHDGFAFYGGYPESERNMLGVFCGGGEVDFLAGRDFPVGSDFPVRCVTVKYQAFSERERLSHRDVLGAVMSCGVKREAVGDILTGENSAVFFCAEAVEGLLLAEIRKIGRTGVRLYSGLHADLPRPETESRRIVLPSMRLDALVGACCGLSREKSAQLVKSGAVRIGGAECTSVSRLMETGDTFTVKGYGRFKLTECGGVTRKGRLQAEVLKFK